MLSHASTITGLPQLRPKLSRESVNVSFASAKPVGAVGEGGNVIWGRQLRPALLLENSPVCKREILKPVLAAASSPAEGGSDSAG